MPYKSIEQLPEPVRHVLPSKAQHIFMEAFDAAYFEHNHNELTAFKIAWSAVKRAGYRKNIKTGKWQLK